MTQGETCKACQASSWQTPCAYPTEINRDLMRRLREAEKTITELREEVSNLRSEIRVLGEFDE